MIIAMYSITDKQKYIFSSPKLKDNIGASILLGVILSRFIEDELTKLNGANFIKEDKTERFFINSKLNFKNYDLIFLFSGGGNALLAFKNKEIFHKFNQLLTKTVFEKSGGGVNLVFTSIEVDDNSRLRYHDIYQRLASDLVYKKRQSTPIYPLLSQSITKTSVSDGMPIINDAEESIITHSKREALHKYIEDYFKDEKILENTKNKDLDALLTDEEDNRLGIIHIDGNRVGAQIKSILSQPKNLDNFERALIITKEIGRKLQKAYTEAFKTLTDKIKEDNIKLRPIVLAGDDVTYAISGKYALASAELFLKEIKEKKEIEIVDKSSIKLSACAGVAIVNKHYPFYRAYALAESLCDSAKKRAKSKDPTNPGNWIDFQLLITPYIKNLDSIRKSYYEENISTNFKKIARPYSIDEPKNHPFSFESFKTLYEEFASKWPKNKLKEFRNIFIESNTEIKLFIEQLKTRRIDLPWIWEDSYRAEEEYLVKIENELITPYFDAVEMYGYYNQLEE